MRRLTTIILTIVILSAASAANVYAMGVDIPFDYYSDSISAYAEASNGNVSVKAGRLGLIQTTDQNGDSEDIKHVCYENIYWLSWTGLEFVAFTDNYKLTSSDGYTWTKTEDLNGLEHEKYGVNKPGSLNSVGYIQIKNTIETNRYEYTADNGQGIRVTILDTGKEYLKLEDILYNNRVGYDRNLYKSSDRKNWEYIKTHYIDDGGDSIFVGKRVEEYPAQIINTGKEYLVRLTNFDNYKNLYNQKHPVMVYDLNFNFVKNIDVSDYIVDMSYVDNIYYITTEEGVSYKSTDLENWEKVGDNIGVPISNGINIIYKTRISVLGNEWTSDHAYAYESPILYSDGNPTKNVVLEDVAPYGTRAYKDFFVCFTNSNGTDESVDFRGIKDVNGKSFNVPDTRRDSLRISFSKDGIYWATLALPVFSVESIDCTNDSILIDTGSSRTLFSIKFSDMEQVVPECDTKVELNDHILGFSQPPVTENDRTLVPMRFLLEQMGAEVTWDDATQTATATVPVTTEEEIQTFGLAEEKSVTFSVDNTTATVNGSAATMDVPARLINDKTMVPLRFLSENLGFDVQWDEATRTAIVTTE